MQVLVLIVKIENLKVLLLGVKWYWFLCSYCPKDKKFSCKKPSTIKLEESSLLKFKMIQKDYHIGQCSRSKLASNTNIFNPCTLCCLLPKFDKRPKSINIVSSMKTNIAEMTWKNSSESGALIPTTKMSKVWSHSKWRTCHINSKSSMILKKSTIKNC